MNANNKTATSKSASRTFAIAAALVVMSGATPALAGNVNYLTLQDVYRPTDALGNAVLGQDGKSGAFRFTPDEINLQTYQAASLFFGDNGDGAIDPGDGEIDVFSGSEPCSQNPGNCFTSGFVFGGSEFEPFFVSGFDATISPGMSGPELTITPFEFAALYQGRNLSLSPDAGSLVVYNFDKAGVYRTEENGDFDVYAYRLGWGHLITEADDPSELVVGFDTRWLLEGYVAALPAIDGEFVFDPIPAIPEPETYALMLAGLGLVGMMAHRRRIRRTG